MTPVLLAAPGNDAMAAALAAGSGWEVGQATVRRFPDGETYARIDASVRDRDVCVVCALDRPDEKFLPVLFMAATARDLGGRRVGLVCPYLPYMRQDRRFHDGEAITAIYFADMVSRAFDWMVTVDPHLHRIRQLSDVYTIPAVATHAAPLLGAWIRRHVTTPLIVGPDEESAQWAGAIAAAAGAPYLVLEKRREGDRSVRVSALEQAGQTPVTPVIVDDIISTGRTIVETIRRVREAGYPPACCVAVHGVFATGAYEELLNAGARVVVTSNTVPHVSNGIDVSGVLIEAIRPMLSAAGAGPG